MRLAILNLSFLFIACSHQPVILKSDDIKVARQEADKSCTEIGPVVGNNISVKGTVEQAIEDMKQDAAKKGANFVRIETTSALGTSVKGTAYSCP